MLGVVVVVVVRLLVLEPPTEIVKDSPLLPEKVVLNPLPLALLDGPVLLPDVELVPETPVEAADGPSALVVVSVVVLLPPAVVPAAVLLPRLVAEPPLRELSPPSPRRDPTPPSPRPSDASPTLASPSEKSPSTAVHAALIETRTLSPATKRATRRGLRSLGDVEPSRTESASHGQATRASGRAVSVGPAEGCGGAQAAQSQSSVTLSM